MHQALQYTLRASWRLQCILQGVLEELDVYLGGRSDLSLSATGGSYCGGSVG